LLAVPLSPANNNHTTHSTPLNMALESVDLTGEKGGDSPAPPYTRASLSDHVRGRQFSIDAQDTAIVTADQNQLHRSLKGRHMQMIAM
jgi:amino acid transporter